MQINRRKLRKQLGTRTSRRSATKNKGSTKIKPREALRRLFQEQNND